MNQTSSLAGYAILAAYICLAIKLLATVLQLLLAKGDYRRYPNTTLFRTVYILGKVTPALAVALLCVSAVLRHDQKSGWVYGLLAVSIALLAAFVVHLRKQGRFYGILDILSSKHK